MKHSKNLLTPAEALYKALQPLCQLQQRRFLYRGRPSPPPSPAPRQPVPPPPEAARTEPRQAQLIPGLQKKLAGYTLNKDIETRWVQIRQEDGKLAAPQMLDTILASINPSSQVVRQLAAQGPTPDTAIVEVQEVNELLKLATARDQAVKQVEKQRKDQKVKVIELNWAISDNDLALKLKQLEQFLDKGSKVEVLLAAKKRQRKAEPGEAEDVVKRLREKVEECGAKELKMEGQLLGQATMTIQKPVKQLPMPRPGSLPLNCTWKSDHH